MNVWRSETSTSFRPPMAIYAKPPLFSNLLTEDRLIRSISATSCNVRNLFRVGIVFIIATSQWITSIFHTKVTGFLLLTSSVYVIQSGGVMPMTAGVQQFLPLWSWAVAASRLFIVHRSFFRSVLVASYMIVLESFFSIRCPIVRTISSKQCVLTLFHPFHEV